MVRKCAQRVVDVRAGPVLARAAYQELVLPREVRALYEMLLLDGCMAVVVRAVLSGRCKRTASLIVESRFDLRRGHARGGREEQRRKAERACGENNHRLRISV